MFFFKHPALQPAALLCRLAWIASIILTVCVIWDNYQPLGRLPGVSLKPDYTSKTAANTKRIMALHALFMELAYVVCMTEALLAYRAPIFNLRTSRMTKLVHMMLHSFALFFIAFGLATGVMIHSDTVPKRDPALVHFRLAHEWTGLFTVVMSAFQFFYGLWVYTLSSYTVEQRREHTKLHNYLGLATYVCGLGACVSGFTKETGGGLLGTAAGSLSYIVGLAGVWVYLYQPKALPQLSTEPFNEIEGEHMAEKNPEDK